MDGKKTNVGESVANRGDFFKSKSRDANVEFTGIGDPESDFEEIEDYDLPF